MGILVFAPHPDDEVLGCGGTIDRYIDKEVDNKGDRFFTVPVCPFRD